jgi:hypothetical protein
MEKYYPSICLEVLESMKYVGQNWWLLSKEQNPGPPEYENGVLTT